MKHYSPILLALACLLAVPAADARQPDCECKPVVVRKKHKVKRVKVHHEVAAPALPPVVAQPPQVLQPPQAPTVVALTLATGSDNCVGSIDAKSPGLTDWNCVLLRKSAALANVGKQDAAVALLCADESMRDALERTGTSCEADDGIEQKPAVERSRVNANLVVKR